MISPVGRSKIYRSTPYGRGKVRCRFESGKKFPQTPPDRPSIRDKLVRVLQKPAMVEESEELSLSTVAFYLTNVLVLCGVV